VKLAPLSEQHRTVEAIEEQITRLDAAVSGLKRVQRQLKRYRASVLKAACEGRLVPTELDLARAEDREYEPADKLLERILAERRAQGGTKYKEPMAPSPAGQLPEGWTWATAEQLVYRSEYGTSVRCAYEGDGLPVLRIPNVAAGRISLDDLKFATMPLAIRDEDALRGGDVLMVRTNGSVGLVGRTAVAPKDMAGPTYFASYLLRFRFAEDATLPRWFSLFATSDQGRRFLESHAASSAGQHNVSLSLIHRWSVPLPPLAEQQRIVAEVERRLSVVEKAEVVVEANLKRAARMRQSILKRAFEGKLVPQDPNDEPASVLLERVRAERERAASTTPKRRGRRPSTESSGGSEKRNGQLRLLDAETAVAAKQRVMRRQQ
jgi:type I restriction enzyme S subunit